MGNNKQLEEAIKFFLWSYFKIHKDYNYDKVIDCIIDRAYIDAASHVLSLDGGNNSREAINAKNKCKDILTNLINNFTDDENWHDNTCNNLCKEYNNINGKIKKNSKDKYKMKFTYGIAQKWVNMTLKYIYLLYGVYCKFEFEASSDYIKNCTKIFENKNKLHVPIDSFIIEAVKVENLSEAPKISSWSKLDGDTGKTDYSDFQNKIREKNNCPIEWENEAWLNVAKTRQEKEDKKNKE